MRLGLVEAWVPVTRVAIEILDPAIAVRHISVSVRGVEELVVADLELMARRRAVQRGATRAVAVFEIQAYTPVARVLLPLACWLAVTLLVPWASGAELRRRGCVGVALLAPLLCADLPLVIIAVAWRNALLSVDAQGGMVAWLGHLMFAGGGPVAAIAAASLGVAAGRGSKAGAAAPRNPDHRPSARHRRLRAARCAPGTDPE